MSYKPGGVGGKTIVKAAPEPVPELDGLSESAGELAPLSPLRVALAAPESPEPVRLTMTSPVAWSMATSEGETAAAAGGGLHVTVGGSGGHVHASGVRANHHAICFQLTR